MSKAKAYIETMYSSTYAFVDYAEEPAMLEGSAVLTPSNYDDEVTQADIDALHEHVAKEFEAPEGLILVGERAW